jgi:hypothetical protein
MDPYLENSPYWRDFHDRLMTHISESLEAALGDQYAAVVNDRLYGLEQTREEVREPYIEIVEPKAGNRLITAIEVLSPDNKHPGPGRQSYLQKRDEFWRGGAHLVEIDLLREGQRVLRAVPDPESCPATSQYIVSVSRRPRCELYPIALRSPLPLINIPLAASDPDVVLDLQAEVAEVWERGPFRKLVPYDRPPPGLSAEDREWCRECLTAAGIGSESNPDPTL